ncbi:Friend virus susceptibility protein 1-like, partial [Huso huso]
WDPERWDGDIWNLDTDDRDYIWDPDNPDPDPNDEPDLESKPPPLQAKPIVRRRQVAGPRGDIVAAQITTEDYTQQERLDIRERYRQKTGEPIDKWLLRMYDTGAGNVRVDVGDYSEFLDLSTDPIIRQWCRGFHNRMDGNNGDTGLLALMVGGADAKYPTLQSWPEMKGSWGTSNECIQRVRELTMREAVFTGHAHEVDEFPFTAGVRAVIIRDAPPPYKGAILALLISEVGTEVGKVVVKIRELGDLGDWSTQVEKKENTQWASRGSYQGNQGNGGGGRRIPRKDLWSKSIQAGVPKENIDGKSTDDLLKMCKQQGLLKQVRPFTAECFCQNYDVRNKKKKEVSSTSEEEESASDEDNENEKSERMVRKKKAGKKGKNKKGKNKIGDRGLYPLAELAQMKREGHY